MGYSTDFSGKLKLTGQVSEELIEYINAFANSRRMKRDIDKLNARFDSNYGLYGEYGIEGEFFVDRNETYSDDESVIDVNKPPKTQPGLWAQWILTKDNSGVYLEWDENEKFYNYIEWLEYYIENFFKPHEIELSGEIEWQGEEPDDFGKIIVENNVMQVKQGIKVYQ